jgi:hypothetical protein
MRWREVGFLFTSRTLIALLIPLVLIGLFFWFLAAVDINRDDVKVAGALVSPVEMDLTVTSTYLDDSSGVRKLFVEMEGRNNSSQDVNLNPAEFQLVLASNEDPSGSMGRHSIFNPMRYTSTCEQAPDSVSSVPPDAIRNVTLVFWGESLPNGEEWDDYFLSLEYYDIGTQLVISKLIRPAEE